MSDTSDFAALLAALPDEELLAVVVAATTGRPGLDRLHVVAAELAAGAGHAAPDAAVTSTTNDPVGPHVSETFGQVVPSAGIPVPPTGISGVGGYSESGVPTFESVRDKVEQRFGTAEGMSELDRQTPAGRSVEEHWEARDKAARERLDRIRESMRGNESG
ncbi:hypothetical protein BJY24_006643 [Nocardia transvalensis]|uniref:Uncharacterized protein n=1 Tax=Nocardia transvalensis TaxID=37333 RepID=A0A7W9ULM7_9NOCA|nr:hypothetical protein [Nocardia transvalensis]MBB5917731.1 hypothetical protein [Nocardia transvalensis]